MLVSSWHTGKIICRSLLTALQMRLDSLDSKPILSKKKDLCRGHNCPTAPTSHRHGGTRLKCEDSFKYIGSTISTDGLLNKEITSRIQKASQALGRLRVKVLQSKGIVLVTKLKIYMDVVLFSLLYGCETWTWYNRHIKQLEQSTTWSIIMNICRQNRVTNQEVVERAVLTSTEQMLLKAQMQCIGHVLPIDDDCLPRQVMHEKLRESSRR